MTATARLLAILLVAASLAAPAAQGDTAILGYVGRSSFWIDVPRGWESDPQTASKLKVIFVLTPTGATLEGADALIIGSGHTNSSVAEAVEKVRTAALAKDPAAEITALPALEDGRSAISMIGIRSNGIHPRPFETVAFIVLQNNVAVVTLSAVTEESHRRGREALMAMLRSQARGGASR